MKNKVTKIIALSIFLTFVGILGLGLFSFPNDSMVMKHGHSDCFNTDCGPLGHIVMHHFIMSDIKGETIDMPALYEYIKDISLDSDTTESPPTPPPQKTLV